MRGGKLSAPKVNLSYRTKGCRESTLRAAEAICSNAVPYALYSLGRCRLSGITAPRRFDLVRARNAVCIGTPRMASERAAGIVPYTFAALIATSTY
jgi:hypothetical protein